MAVERFQRLVQDSEPDRMVCMSGADNQHLTPRDDPNEQSLPFDIRQRINIDSHDTYHSEEKIYPEYS